MSEEEKEKCLVPVKKKEHKIYGPSKKVLKNIPKELEEDLILHKTISDSLPENYNFEIVKSIWRIRESKAKVVLLQFPEGLLIFSENIAGILEKWTKAEIIISSDVSYGACCIDDLSATALQAQFMIHYGHSCLIPMNENKMMPCLYVFVDIKFDSVHLLESITTSFDRQTKLALVSIIQFVSSLQSIAIELRSLGYTVEVPQNRPLSPGEILGCTSAPVSNGYTIICLGDGRFHLESIMISNPDITTYLYNPYLKVLSREHYDQPKMKSIRRQEIDKAVQAQIWGVILGTLGRQGSPAVLDTIKSQLTEAGKRFIVVYMSEIFPATLEKFTNIDCWVQIACPRLSIDWGSFFKVPLLNSYEASVALKHVEWNMKTYPMDYYANDSLGKWTPNHVPPCTCGKTASNGCKGRKRCPGRNKNI